MVWGFPRLGPTRCSGLCRRSSCAGKGACPSRQSCQDWHIPSILLLELQKYTAIEIIQPNCFDECDRVEVARIRRRLSHNLASAASHTAIWRATLSGCEASDCPSDALCLNCDHESTLCRYQDRA